ncbi:MAG: MFS transporter, partial [Clostridia bacterium]|nr:MFS transporter [Clostridia bacterium]
MKFTYKHTKYSCYLGSVTSAIINNFAALLFVVFNKDFGISIEQISLLITTNFAVQLVVDYLGARY